jgi:hypothetical protein
MSTLGFLGADIAFIVAVYFIIVLKSNNKPSLINNKEKIQKKRVQKRKNNCIFGG